MFLANPQRIQDQIATLLSREKSALLKGDLQAAAELANKKMTLFAKVSTLDLPEPALKELHARLQENHALYASASQNKLGTSNTQGRKA